MSVAMQRLGKAIGAVDWPSCHDLRRSVATRMAKAGVSGEDIGAVLNHVRRDVTSVHYNQHDRLEEKKKALRRWEHVLIGILTPQPDTAKIVSLRG